MKIAGAERVCVRVKQNATGSVFSLDTLVSFALVVQFPVAFIYLCVCVCACVIAYDPLEAVYGEIPD